MCEISSDKWSLVEKQWPWYHKACILIPVLSYIFTCDLGFLLCKTGTIISLSQNCYKYSWIHKEVL